MLRLDQEIRLRDGRRLVYDEWGAPDGIPVLYCHGVPSSRAECRLTVDTSTVADLGLRIIAVDRPGVGASDPLPGRRITGWPGDVAQLLDELHIWRCAVLGSSGGSAYALACGALLADRVNVVGLVGCQGPPDAPGLSTFGARLLAGAARHAPALMSLLLRLQLTATRGEKSRARMVDWFPEPDRTLLRDRGVRDGFIACFEQACTRGVQGVAWDVILTANPWGFEPAAVGVPVLLWQGERDGNVAETHGRHLARTIPGCQATFYPDDAHLSTPLTHQREIYAALRQAFLQTQAARAGARPVTQRAGAPAPA